MLRTHMHASHLDLLALLEHVRHRADAALDELRDVDQAVDAVLEPDERSEILDTRDGARDVRLLVGADELGEVLGPAPAAW